MCDLQAVIVFFRLKIGLILDDKELRLEGTVKINKIRKKKNAGYNIKQ
jgi:hypothetical protein